ncbi:MAG: ATP-dependent protease ATPase subunit HslU [Holosporales bacterium]|jgi:ATP-dependent HslUV protease ATP-binding subunit HslU|nr:ATP-dependent protease ATPase subunit HslU [Holosporales bacterium]
MENLTPKKIVAELSRHIVGQYDAKKAVAIALRNRWRRMNLPDGLKEEVLPKNILMVGATGIGKTEIARRLAKLVQAPFVKVEATKFTEIGYVGRDVEQIIRDLIETAVGMMRQNMWAKVETEARTAAEERLLDTLTGPAAGLETRLRFKKKLYDGELDDQMIEIRVNDTPSGSQFMDIPGMPGSQLGMANLSDMFSQVFGKDKLVLKKMTVKEAMKILIEEESEKLVDNGQITRQAIEATEQNGIVFIDEIDKICSTRDDHRSSSVSQEGVQRDLLPLIEGTTVATKYGQVKTDHILFIASGAFQISSPSDLLPELQGRLPIRVDLSPLTRDDFIKILKEPEANLIRQSQALLATEGIEVQFDDSAIECIADVAVELNNTLENIGARRLYTVIENMLEDLSFNSDDYKGQSVYITKEWIENRPQKAKNTLDLKQFIL